MGDFRAQIAAIRTGERRLTRLLQRYGAETFKESVRLIFDQSEKLARAAVEKIPDGVYEAESFMDDDGVNLGKHVPIKVRVEVQGDEMTVDLSGVSPQVAGPYNSGSTAGRSASEVAFKFLTTPLLLPINHGSFRPLKVILPPGRIVSATKPAPVRTWMTVPMTVADTIFKALAPACPDNVMAGQHADLAIPRTFGLDPKTGRAFHFPQTLSGGGWGALHDRDGQNATFCINDGDTHNTPVEAGEGKGPIFISYRKLREDSGGPGKFRGGLGVAQEVRMLAPASVQSAMERTLCPPWGLHGGKDAMANRFSIVRKDGSVQRLPTGKTAGHVALEAGDGFLVEVGGGGGFWNPLERDPERVLDDVRSGYVSLEAARRDYGVVIRAERTEVRDRRCSYTGVEASVCLISGSFRLRLWRGEKISIDVMLSLSEASRVSVKDEDEILRLSAQDDISDAIAVERGNLLISSAVPCPATESNFLIGGGSMMTNNQRGRLSCNFGGSVSAGCFASAGIRPRNPNQDPHFLSQHLDLLPGFVRRAAVEDLRAERPRC